MGDTPGVAVVVTAVGVDAEATGVVEWAVVMPTMVTDVRASPAAPNTGDRFTQNPSAPFLHCTQQVVAALCRSGRPGTGLSERANGCGRARQVPGVFPPLVARKT